MNSKFSVYSYTWVFAFILISCSEKNNGKDISVPSITISLHENPPVTFEDVITSMEVLRLSEPEDKPIGVIKKIIIDKDKVFVLDSDKAKALFIFDSKGQFIYAIDAVGQAEGEFLAPDDFTWDKQKREIVILDKNKQQLLFYNESGKYQRKILLGSYVNGFTAFEKDKFILDKGNSNGDGSGKLLNVIEKENGSLVNSMLARSKHKENLTFSPLNSFYSYGDTVHYIPSMSNEVYSIQEGEAILKFKIDFGKLWATDQYLERISDQHPINIMKKINSDGYILFPNVLENKTSIYIDFTYKSNKYYAYYDKRKGNIVHFKINENLFDNFTPVGQTDNSFISTKYSNEGHTVLVFYNFI